MTGLVVPPDSSAGAPRSSKSLSRLFRGPALVYRGPIPANHRAPDIAVTQWERGPRSFLSTARPHCLVTSTPDREGAGVAPIIAHGRGAEASGARDGREQTEELSL